MKIILASFILMLISLLSFIPINVPSIINDWKDIAIPVLSFFILLVAVCSNKKQIDHFETLRKSEFETDEELAKRIHDEMESIRGDNLVLIEGKDTVQARLQEVLQELKAQKEENLDENAMMKRNAQIDAELVNLLSILQEKGRLIDFFMDDITAYPDDQVGAAARVVHTGCAKALKEYFTIKSIQENDEGSTVTLEEGFDAEHYRLIGNIGGNAPFTGKLVHHGWIVEKISLPRLLKTGEKLEQHRVISPAEIEIA